MEGSQRAPDRMRLGGRTTLALVVITTVAVGWFTLGRSTERHDTVIHTTSPCGAPQWGSDGPQGLVGLDALTGRRRWSVPVEGGATGPFGSTVVTLGSNGMARGIDAATGAERWCRKVVRTEHTVAITSAAAGETLAVASGADVVGLDPATGTQRWRISSAGGLAFVSTASDGSAHDFVIGASTSLPLYAVARIDGTTGRQRWRAVIQDCTRPDAPPACGPPVVDHVAVADQTVLVTTAEGMVALDFVTGRTRWTMPQASGMYVATQHAFAVPAASQNDITIRIVDARSGVPHQVGIHSRVRESLSGLAAVGHRVVVLSQRDGDRAFLSSYNAATSRWQFAVELPNVYATDVIADAGHFYTGGQTAVTKVAADGHIVWSHVERPQYFKGDYTEPGEVVADVVVPAANVVVVGVTTGRPYRD